MNLSYGLHWDRDFLVDIVFRVQSVMPIISSLTIYPVSFYLLLVEGPTMIREIRAAYIAYFVVHSLFDVIFSSLLRVYVFPPFGLFYCEGILCTSGLDKQNVVAILSGVVIMCIPPYVFLIIRMHQLVVKESASRMKLSWKFQLAFMLSLTVVLIINVFGFVIYTTDVSNYDELVRTPELEWIEKRGGTLLLFGEPGKISRFVNEMLLFGASFSIFLSPVIFLNTHAMRTLKKSSMNAFSNKTQQLMMKVFEVFRLQFRSGTFLFVIPLCFDMSAAVVDLRQILPAPLFALARFGAVMLFTLNPAVFALIFILRNEKHREILRRRFMCLPSKKSTPSQKRTITEVIVIR